jgi:2-phosphosulfolactate phosphatase
MPVVHFALGEPGAVAAGRRGDIVIIVDALRASVTTVAALAAGVARVVPIGSVAEARTWLGRPGTWVAGERDGARVPGFDLGNSPVEMLRRASELRGCTLVHTTTNGTRCTAAAATFNPPAIFTGSLPNATPLLTSALATARRFDVNVTLVAAGVFDEPVSEDDLTVSWLAQMLVAAGAQLANPSPVASLPSAERLQEYFAATEDGMTLASLGLAGDVEFCAQLDVLDVVPIYRDGAFMQYESLLGAQKS